MPRDFLRLLGLAAGATASLSSWNWYNHAMPFALASIVDQVVCFFVAGLVIGWARKKLAGAS